MSTHKQQAFTRVRYSIIIITIQIRVLRTLNVLYFSKSGIEKKKMPANTMRFI